MLPHPDDHVNGCAQRGPSTRIQRNLKPRKPSEDLPLGAEDDWDPAPAKSASDGRIERNLKPRKPPEDLPLADEDDDSDAPARSTTRGRDELTARAAGTPPDTKPAPPRSRAANAPSVQTAGAHPIDKPVPSAFRFSLKPPNVTEAEWERAKALKMAELEAKVKEKAKREAEEKALTDARRQQRAQETDEEVGWVDLEWIGEEEDEQQDILQSGRQDAQVEGAGRSESPAPAPDDRNGNWCDSPIEDKQYANIYRGHVVAISKWVRHVVGQFPGGNSNHREILTQLAYWLAPEDRQGRSPRGNNDKPPANEAQLPTKKAAPRAKGHYLYVDDGGYYWLIFSDNELGQQTGQSRRQVQTALGWLIDKEIVLVGQGSGRFGPQTRLLRLNRARMQDIIRDERQKELTCKDRRKHQT